MALGVARLIHSVDPSFQFEIHFVSQLLRKVLFQLKSWLLSNVMTSICKKGVLPRAVKPTSRWKSILWLDVMLFTCKEGVLRFVVMPLSGKRSALRRTVLPKISWKSVLHSGVVNFSSRETALRCFFVSFYRCGVLEVWETVFQRGSLHGFSPN